MHGLERGRYIDDEDIDDTTTTSRDTSHDISVADSELSGRDRWVEDLDGLCERLAKQHIDRSAIRRMNAERKRL